MFIAIEGMDLAGKSTFTNRLKENLEGLGFKVLLTREPGGVDPNCSKIRDILVNNDLDQMTQMLLFQANRTLHNNNIIKPALHGEDNVIVISDRYYLATYVYQHDVVKLAKEISIKANHEEPDLTVVVWADEKTTRERMAKRSEEGGEINFMDEFFTKDYPKYQELYFKALAKLDGAGISMCTSEGESSYEHQLSYITQLISSRAKSIFDKKAA